MLAPTKQPDRFASVIRIAFFLLALVAPLPVGAQATAEETTTGQIGFESLEGKIRVTIDGELFTELLYQGWRKPILYPIVGPHGIGMTRNYPMKPGVAGENEDHPHHQSLWFTHGEMNDENFWTGEEGAGNVVCNGVPKTTIDPDCGTIQFTNQWVSDAGEAVCSDRTTLRFSAIPKGRVIDWEITLVADQGEVVFGDTKEGTMAIRTHPLLHITDPSRGILAATGHAINSEGVEGAAVWGKRAAWVDYWNEIEGHTVGIAVMDHPRNLRHPSWWHARSYGLVAVNPFGIYDFEGGAVDAGAYTLLEGESLTLRYRFVFHEGDTEGADVAQLFEDYGKPSE